MLGSFSFRDNETAIISGNSGNILKYTFNETCDTNNSNNRNANTFEYFPNPFQEKFYIKSKVKDLSFNYIIEIIDLNGKTVYKTQRNNTNEEEIQCDNLKDGIYFLSVKHNMTKEVAKIVKIGRKK